MKERQVKPSLFGPINLMLVKFIKKWFGGADVEKVICPWHNETVASLILNHKNKTYHCCGCSKSGSLNEYLKKTQVKNYAE